MNNIFVIMFVGILFVSMNVFAADGQNFDIKDAQNAYKIMQDRKNEEKMKQDQKDAGIFVPGPTDFKVKDVYVSPAMVNGAPGGTLTIPLANPK